MGLASLLIKGLIVRAFLTISENQLALGGAVSPISRDSDVKVSEI